MFELEQSELALIQRQCERAHIAQPDTAMSMLLLPTRNQASEYEKLPPFARADGSLVREQGRIVNSYEHSQGYVQIRFYGSDEAQRLYEHIATTACQAMPNKRLASCWGEYLFEVRQFRDRPIRFVTEIPRSVILQENPFLASAIAIQQILVGPVVDTELVKGRSMEALRVKFLSAADRLPDARHHVLIGDCQLDHHGGGEYSFKTPQGRWWRCGVTGVEMNEFGRLCRSAGQILADDPRSTLMPKPDLRAGFAPDDAWMMFVHRLAWTEPANSELRAAMKMAGGNRVSAEVARHEPTGLYSELRPNLYAACAMAIDVVSELPSLSSDNVAAATANPHDTMANLMGTTNVTEQCIIDALREKGRRLTHEPLLHLALGKVNSNGKAALASMVKRGLLNNRSDARGKGYGLPEWG